MDVHQISIHYDADQDRILVRISTPAHEEVQMWLTRRLLVGLWPLLNRITADHFAPPPLAQASGSGALERTDFRTPYQAMVLHRPLGDVPLLVSEVNLTPRDGELLQLGFREQVDGSQRSFQMDLRAELLHGVLELLRQALGQSQWLVGADAGSTVLVTARPAETADEIDLAKYEKRPRYLN